MALFGLGRMASMAIAVGALTAVVEGAVWWLRADAVSDERERERAAKLQNQNDAFKDKADIEREIDHAEQDRIKCILRAADPADCGLR